MHVQLSLSLHFYLLYLHLSSCNGNDVKLKLLVFVSRLLVALKRTGCVAGSEKRWFRLGDVQSDVILPSCLHATAFCIDQLLCR